METLVKNLKIMVYLILKGRHILFTTTDLCREETGFDVTEWRYRGIVTFISDIWPCEYMHLFSATRWSGEEIVCDEGDLKWVDKKHIFDYPTWAGDRIFLRLILDDAPFFSLKLIYHGDDLYAAKLNGRPIEDLQIFG